MTCRKLEPKSGTWEKMLSFPTGVEACHFTPQNRTYVGLGHFEARGARLVPPALTLTNREMWGRGQGNAGRRGGASGGGRELEGRRQHCFKLGKLTRVRETLRSIPTRGRVAGPCFPSSPPREPWPAFCRGPRPPLQGQADPTR